MASVRVTHSIGDLAADCARIATTTKSKMAAVVRRNTEQGNKLAQGFARASAGPHGINAYKRLTGEMTGPLTGEFGWTGDASRIVGAGWRHGPPNNDLPRSADIIGPKFAKDVGDEAEGMFW